MDISFKFYDEYMVYSISASLRTAAWAAVPCPACGPGCAQPRPPLHLSMCNTWSIIGVENVRVRLLATAQWPGGESGRVIELMASLKRSISS